MAEPYDPFAAQPPQRAGQALHPVEETEDLDFASLYKLATIDDPNAEKKIIAEHYGVDPQKLEQGPRGQWQWKDEQGKLHMHDPYVTFRKIAATALAYAPEVVMGTAMGAATGGMGLAPALGLTGLATAGGEGFRQAQGAMFGDRQPYDLRRARMGLAGATAMAGEGAGRALLGRPISRMVNADPATVARNQGVMEQAGLQGTATLDQLADDPALAGYKIMAANQPSRSARTLAEAERAGDERVVGRMDRFARDLGATDVDEAGRIASERVRQARVKLEAERAAAADPYYAKARKKNPAIDASDVMGDLSKASAQVKDPATKAAVDDVVDILGDGRISYLDWEGPPDIGGGVKDRLQSVLNRLDEVGDYGRKSKVYRRVVQLKSELQDRFADVSDEFRIAQRIYREDFPLADAASRGNVGKIAKGDALDPITVSKAVDGLLNNRLTPKQIRMHKEIVNAADPTGKDWNAIVGSWTRKTVNGALKEAQDAGRVVNTPGKIRMALYSTPGRRAQMQAMLGPQKFKEFEKIMDGLQVLQRYRVDKVISQTAGQETAKTTAKALGSPINRRILNFKRIYNANTDIESVSKFSDQIVNILLDPKKSRQLRKLMTYKMKSKAFLVGLMDLLAIPYVLEGADEAVTAVENIANAVNQ